MKSFYDLLILVSLFGDNNLSLNELTLLLTRLVNCVNNSLIFIDLSTAKFWLEESGEKRDSAAVSSPLAIN